MTHDFNKIHRDRYEKEKELLAVPGNYVNFLYEFISEINIAASAAKLIINSLPSGSCVLDVGCGTGRCSSMLQGAGYRLIVTDPSPDAIQIASSRMGNDPAVTFRVSNLEELTNNCIDPVDGIVCLEVIEHVHDPLAFLKLLSRLLKPNGYLVLSTPCPYGIIFSYANKGMFRSLKKIMRYLRPEVNWKESLDTHPAVRPAILRKWCVESGFKVIKHFSLCPYYFADGPSRCFSNWLLSIDKKWGTSFFQNYYTLEDWLIRRTSIMKWCGTRQMLLVKK